MPKLVIEQTLEERLQIIRQNYALYREQLDKADDVDDDKRISYTLTFDLQERLEIMLETWLEELGDVERRHIANAMMGSAGKIIEMSARIGSDDASERHDRCMDFFKELIEVLFKMGVFELSEQNKQRMH